MFWLHAERKRIISTSTAKVSSQRKAADKIEKGSKLIPVFHFSKNIVFSVSHSAFHLPNHRLCLKRTKKPKKTKQNKTQMGLCPLNQIWINKRLGYFLERRISLSFFLPPLSLSHNTHTHIYIYIYKYIYIYIYNLGSVPVYRYWKWTSWHDFESWTGLFVFQIAAILFWKIWIWPCYGDQSRRRETPSWNQ